MAAEDWEDAAPASAPAAPAQSWGDYISDTANDFGRSVSNAATFGMANRLKGYISGTGTDEQARLSEVARERSPIASTAGDVYGAFAVPGLGAENLAARMGGRVLARAGAYGLTGAATGAAQGAGNTYSGKLPDYVQNALVGGAIGAPMGAIGGAVFGRRPARSAAETPNVRELQVDKNAAYDTLKASPAQYDAMHLAHRGDALEHQFQTVDRFTPRDSPSTFRALDDMREPYAAAVQAGPSAMATVDPANIDYIRRGINKIPPSAERAVDRESGRAVKGALDDFLENPPPGAVMPGYEGAARDAAATALLARQSNGAYKRAQLSETMRGNAENRAASNYSGLNLENELRKEYRNLLNTDKKSGLSGAERAGYNRRRDQPLPAIRIRYRHAWPQCHALGRQDRGRWQRARLPGCGRRRRRRRRSLHLR
jgi:hypothetical protein